MDSFPKSLNLDKFKKNSTATVNNSKITISTTPALPKFVEVEKRRIAVLAGIDNIPSLPTIVMEIVKIANSKSSSASDIEAQMKADQVLTAKVLKIANSSYYALTNKVSTITRAVATIGFNSMKSIVISTSVSDTLNKDLSIYGFIKNGLWEHSLACAAIAKLIGQKVYHLNEEQTEELFIGGLLHDIGKIVLAPQLHIYKDEFYKYRKAEDSSWLEKSESAILGINHQEAGAILCKRWNLSEQLQNAIANHHSHSQNQFDSIISISEMICYENMIGLANDFKGVYQIPPELLQVLGISDTNIVRLQEFFKAYIEKEVKALIQTMNFN